jgi:pilus assembly protein Flp/PilA
MEPSDPLATIRSEKITSKPEPSKIREGIKMFAMINSVLQNKKGQGMVEYGLILALVSIAAIALLGTMGSSLQTQFQAVITAL